MNTGTVRWEPMAVKDAVRLFDQAPFRWWIAGGFALELHVGERWREHVDLDIGVCREEAVAVHHWLQSWDMCVAARGNLTSWNGRPLLADASENNVWVRRVPEDPWVIDLTINEGTRDVWLYRRDTTVSRAWEQAVLQSHSGVPYLAPDLQLLFKASPLGDKDKLDAARVIPLMDEEQRTWLSERLSPDHPWQKALADRR